MDNNRILLSSPHMGGEEIKQIQNAFETNWIAPAGPHIEEFEKKLSKIHQNKFVAAVQSGTAAIHLALDLLGVDQGDIVLCQSFTFIGSINPVKYIKAIPVLVDSEMETWNICPEALETAIKKHITIGKKPKAIIVVHLYGMPAKMKNIIELSKKYEIPIIEDAAESLGSKIDNILCGCFGDFGILSFNGNKIITTSGGGAIISSDDKAIVKARFLSTQAKENAEHYEHKEIGYNYCLSNVSAAIGIGQLSVLEERILARRKNYYFYYNLLSSIEGISFLDEPKGYYSNRWLTSIVIDKSKFKNIDSRKLRLTLERENIESRPLWKPMHLQPIFKDCSYFGSNISENLFNKGLCLPSGSNLTDNQLKRIKKVLSDFFKLI
tara:strand:+ start:668 stop:1807 length:1140 start_codon:yes stop_codon:yes gene_type:complete